MTLTGTENTSFELNVLGYQFPAIEHDEYDSNWLSVKIDVRLPNGAWSSTDPCLLTWELSRLAAWFDTIAQGSAAEPHEDFMEPNLLFELVQALPNRLRVYFELECRPSWAPSDGAGMNDLWAEFEVTPHKLEQAAKSLRGQLKEFPVRAGGRLS